MKKQLLSFALLASSFVFGQWNLTGNTGTDPSTNFMGTSDSKDLVIRTNNIERMRVTSSGEIGIGAQAKPNWAINLQGKTMFTSLRPEDSFIFFNDAPNILTGSDLMWLSFKYYQPNEIGMLTLSSASSASDWAKPIFSVRANGNVFIGSRTDYTLAGCADCVEYKLFVKNGIKAEKVKVELSSANGWADYVFKKEYKLRSLEEVEKHIEEKGHLPNIPAAEDVVKNGINLGEMDAKLLEKIEELTLYSIEQNKHIKQLQEENKILKSQAADIKELKKQVQELLSTKK
ncbi:hypothetical protein GCM10022217_41620 [Chryseobacterium ginsenosidimutans]|uniref:cell wall anchor protein n=1 Tax=Chryseobacterium ginsenosidimutans TaxID=687846 RepID=UPI0031DF8AA1